jgi:hypothetical protein
LFTDVVMPDMNGRRKVAGQKMDGRAPPTVAGGAGLVLRRMELDPSGVSNDLPVFWFPELSKFRPRSFGPANVIGVATPNNPSELLGPDSSPIVPRRRGPPPCRVGK